MPSGFITKKFQWLHCIVSEFPRLLQLDTVLGDGNGRRKLFAQLQREASDHRRNSLPRRLCSTDTGDCCLQPPCGQCLPWRQKSAQLLVPTSTHTHTAPAEVTLPQSTKKTMGVAAPAPFATWISSCTTVVSLRVHK